MVFSADGRILIKVLRQEKGYGAEKFIAEFLSKPDLGEPAGACVCIAAGFMTLTSWSHAWSKSGNISTRSSLMKRSGSGIHVFQLAFEHTEGILNTYFSYVWYLYRRRPTLRHSDVCAVIYSEHFCFGGDLTKPPITIASVDIFYLNLVICLQLDIALLVQNSVRIWHCLSELWQCIQAVTFFLDTVYNQIKIQSCVILRRSNH